MNIIKRNELKNELDKHSKNFHLIDVLDRDSFRDSHISGAINIPVKEESFLQNVSKAVPDKSEKVVVYCSDKSCEASSTAADKLSKAGYKMVYAYEAGKADWREAGLPMEGTEAPKKSFSSSEQRKPFSSDEQRKTPSSSEQRKPFSSDEQRKSSDEDKSRVAV